MISDINVDILWAKPFKVKEKKKENAQYVLVALK
jgi:hypothetical protein